MIVWRLHRAFASHWLRSAEKQALQLLFFNMISLPLIPWI